ncbi:MAG TPA: putative quinol monooxygenase [Casimicrobiaceae bacterium]|nr:putative quinol monooxygenase [Casimicrobiaceae bacterium]
MPGILTVVAHLRAAPGKGDALAALLVEQARVVRASEPGCLVYRPHRSTRDPDAFVFYETYVDDAAFEAHRSAPHLASFRARREQEGLVDGQARVELFRSLTD